MDFLGKSTMILVVAALMLAVLTCASGQVEYRPGEKAAEDLFNKGIGKAWVGGEPFKSNQWTWPKQTYIAKPYTSYRIVGYINAGSGFSISSDLGESLQLQSGPGSYPIYGYYSGDRLMGLFIDLSSSGSLVRMYPSL